MSILLRSELDDRVNAGRDVVEDVQQSYETEHDSYEDDTEDSY